MSNARVFGLLFGWAAICQVACNVDVTGGASDRGPTTEDGGGPSGDGGECDVAWYCHFRAGECCSDVVQSPTCENGKATCPTDMIPGPECTCGTWDAGNVPDVGDEKDSGADGADAATADAGITDTGPADTGTLDAGTLSCSVREDCPGTPPLKCLGAHWECVNGECVGACGTDCKPLDGCMLDCEFGFKTGPDGCPVCECGGPVDCPPVCGIYCEYGYKLGPDGCPLCECNEPPACPPFACDIYCEFGFKTDPRGCTVCDCIEPLAQCGGIAGFTCPEGFHCKIEAPYPDAMGLCFPACDDPGVRCPPGSACENVDPILESPKACLPACEPAPCGLLCPWGYERNEMGCEVCRCAQAPGCPKNPCDLYCPWGYAIDPDGCEVCACAEKPGCPSLDLCRPICFEGRKIGPDGCPTCECNDHKCTYSCNMDCICEQDHFGCDLPQCRTYDWCGGFAGEPCPDGQICVLPDMPDAMGVCVPPCASDSMGCPPDRVCIPVAPGENGPQFGCVKPCETGCDVFCPNGYEKDWRGCDQCKCHVCPALGCDPRCEFGVQVDAMGCPTCQCREHPAPCAGDPPGCPAGLRCDPDTNLCLAECGGIHGIPCPEPRDWCKPLDPNDVDGMGVCVPTE